MLLLTIRLEIEAIFKNTYPLIMNDPETEETAMRLISGAITEMIDPKLYFSRFSFLESGKDAIDIKHKLYRRQSNGASTENSPTPFLPNVKNKYNQRSTLMKNLFPIPSEGKVRAMFLEPSPNLKNSLPKIARRSLTMRTQADEILPSKYLSKSPMRGDTKLLH
jgi:hypothetical protein